jgi:hypothetical protein
MNENDFTDPFSNVTKVEDVVCRDCNKTFRINAQYDKNGVPVSFRAKYCTDCNLKMKKPDITVTGAIGANIVSASIPQKNVEGLEDALGDISIFANDSRRRIIDLEQDFSSHKDEFKAFKKHIEHDIEEKEFEFDIFKNVTEQVIKNNRLDLDVFKSAQNMINERHFNHIKKLTRESMIMFFMVILLFVIDLATIWCYIRK